MTFKVFTFEYRVSLQNNRWRVVRLYYGSMPIHKNSIRTQNIDSKLRRFSDNSMERPIHAVRVKRHFSKYDSLRLFMFRYVSYTCRIVYFYRLLVLRSDANDMTGTRSFLSVLAKTNYFRSLRNKINYNSHSFSLLIGVLLRQTMQTHGTIQARRCNGRNILSCKIQMNMIFFQRLCCAESKKKPENKDSPVFAHSIVRVIRTRPTCETAMGLWRNAMRSSAVKTTKTSFFTIIKCVCCWCRRSWWRKHFGLEGVEIQKPKTIYLLATREKPFILCIVHMCRRKRLREPITSKGKLRKAYIHRIYNLKKNTYVHSNNLKLRDRGQRLFQLDNSKQF